MFLINIQLSLVFKALWNKLLLLSRLAESAARVSNVDEDIKAERQTSSGQFRKWHDEYYSVFRLLNILEV